jgi:peptidoglycan/xylan/chitin deacetylase (PgdA/CDA1 family)
MDYRKTVDARKSPGERLLSVYLEIRDRFCNVPARSPFYIADSLQPRCEGGVRALLIGRNTAHLTGLVAGRTPREILQLRKQTSAASSAAGGFESKPHNPDPRKSPSRGVQKSDKEPPRLSRRIKALAGWVIFRSGLYRFFRRNEAVVVLFHRVNDAYPNDPLTYTSGEFEAFIRFFGRYFNVVPLTEVLQRLESGNELRSRLAITFDDGYQGNATIAAPILERYGQRACFFITTGWIGTNHVPWWDAEKHIETVWMSWDQVRGLRDAGHEIGAHTQTHPDLGKIGPNEARREITGALAQLETELGERAGLFAYPFGGRKNMSEANQEMIEQLGLRCSLSAFGGTVNPRDNPLRLRRITISDWFISPYQFGFELVTRSLDAD